MEKLKQAKEFIPDLDIIVQKSRLSRSKYGLAQKYTFSIITKKGKYTGIFTDSSYNYKNDVTINLDNILYSWIVDADSFDYSQDFNDFCEQFGCDFKNYNIHNDEYRLRKNKLEKTRKACKYAYRKMTELLTDEQIEELHDLFQDY